MSTGVRTAVGRFVWHDHMSDDPAAASRFYSKVFGWEIEVWKPGEMDYPMIKAGDTTHGGFGPARGGAPAHWLGHLAVEGADEAGARAEAAGGRILAPALDIPEVGRMVVVADPAGATVSLFQPAGEMSVPAGAFVWDELMTQDVEGAKRFYGEVAGWAARDVEMGGSGVYTLFSSGDVDCAGCLTPPEGVEQPAFWLTYLGADDVDATIEKAEAGGAKTQMPATDVPNVGRLAVLADPLGAFFGLFRPAES